MLWISDSVLVSFLSLRSTIEDLLNCDAMGRTGLVFCVCIMITLKMLAQVSGAWKIKRRKKQH